MSMFDRKNKEDFEKFRDLFECFGCEYELHYNVIKIIDNKWKMKILIPLTQRSFMFRIEMTGDRKDIGISNNMWLALKEVAKEYNK